MTAESVPLVQTPKKAPLPCYGLEHNAQDPRCQRCPHQTSCIEAMGARFTHVPLSKAKFRLVPTGYGFVYEDIEFEDPELSNLPQLYIECHKTIFGKNPNDRPHPKVLAELGLTAKRLEASVRMYMLAVMTGHRAHEVDVVRLSERGKTLPFSASMLIGKVAEARFRTFSELTVKEFGHFSLSSLSTLLGYNFEKNSPEERLYNSEIKAGQCIIGYKMGTGGPFYEHLYTECELTLDPLWLAIEPSYKSLVLDPYRENPRGSRLERDHRHDVSRAVGYLKKHKDAAIMVFQAREAAMPRAIKEVVSLFGYGVDDFMVADEFLTDCLNVWNYIAIAMQHLECLDFVNKGGSKLIRSI